MARRRRPHLVIRLYLKSGQVIRFYASSVTLTKGPDGEYTHWQGDDILGENLKGSAPEQVAAWTTERRRWWHL
jgi:hypothetical protein